MAEYGIALTTFADERQATPVIEEILNRNLAACAQEIHIKSRYRWKGALCRDDEVLVLLKTRKELYPELEKTLLALHPYETPEILFLGAEAGSAAYLAWVDGQTRKPSKEK